MKKLFTILAAAFVVSLAACNGSGDGTKTDTTAATTDTTATDQVTTPTTTDTSAASADTTHKM